MEREEYDITSYMYALPQENIALYPQEKSEEDKLLVYNRSTQSISHSTFNNILSFFSSPVLFVVNDSKVLPARLIIQRKTGAQIEVLILSALPLLEVQEYGDTLQCIATVLLKGAKRCSLGEVLYGKEYTITLIEKLQYGQYKVQFQWNKKRTLQDICQEYGSMPLPPYIKRKQEDADKERYQSIFANSYKCGSVAAPTASLHCTHEFIKEVHNHGSSIAYVTLYVGYGTFVPVRTEDIREHTMHEEYISIDEENARIIREAQENNIPIIAIGTTSLRVLESIFAQYHSIQACSMMTDLYITPGYQFHVVNGLLTNFHLPESSLLILVSAFASRKSIVKAYEEAIQYGYRFFSYGDAMLIL